MPILTKHARLAVPLLAALLIAACGGSHHDGGPVTTTPPVTDPPPTVSIPASASASVAGFIAYLKALLAASSDQLEPVDTATFVAPVDDQAEPVAVD